MVEKEKILALRIAVLVACYNRKEKTLSFLESLTTQNIFNKLKIDIYLLDDGSTDGTGEAVTSKYPFIKLVTGDGKLFWAGGMRKVWNFANAQKEYDLFLLFNDDIKLFEGGLNKLLTSYVELNKKGVVLIGSTLNPQNNSITYGGYSFFNLKRPRYHSIIPDETKVVPCQIGNANILAVDAEVVKKIGVFSDAYIHVLADLDYTLSAFKAGFDVLIAPGYYAYCENDHGVNWLSNNSTLKKRIEFLYSPKGLGYFEYLHYVKKHFPSFYFIAFSKLWLKTLFPIIWDKFKNKDDL